MATAPRFPDLAACSADELRRLVIGLWEANAKLEAAVAAVAEENARLKVLCGRPPVSMASGWLAASRRRGEPPEGPFCLLG